MTSEQQFQKIRVVHRVGRLGGLAREDLSKMSATTDTKASVQDQMDEAALNHPSHGLILPPEDPEAGPLEEMAHQILDDVAFNVIQELLMSVYREEKVARCNTAAMFLEQKAKAALKDDDPTTPTENENPNYKAFEFKIETDLVRFDADGNTTLVQDTIFPHIMEAIPVAHCPNCKLPRFPYPGVGEGSRVPEAGVKYCKKHVFVQNKPADVYDQTFTADKKGPGRGNGKKKLDKDSPTASPSANDAKTNINTPSVKCPIKGCTKHNPVNRMGRHLSQDHGAQSGRRDAQKAAMQKMQDSNANGNGSSTSRRSTPTPSQNSKGRQSPSKRDLSEIDSDESPQKPKKSKSLASTKKKLQAPAMARTSSQLSNSNLNHVETHLSDDEFVNDDDDDDHRDADFGSIAVEAKKKKKLVPKSIKLKAANGTSGEKVTKPKAAKTIAPKKARDSTPATTVKPKIKLEVNGQSKKQSKPRDDSESSQTLSSPN